MTRKFLKLMNDEHLHTWVKSCEGVPADYEEALGDGKGVSVAESRSERDWEACFFPSCVSGRGLDMTNREVHQVPTAHLGPPRGEKNRKRRRESSAKRVPRHI